MIKGIGNALSIFDLFKSRDEHCVHVYTNQSSESGEASHRLPFIFLAAKAFSG
jgi:hypothetical protein